MPTILDRPIITGRESSLSLYNPNLATFESDQVYSQKDAEGFIKLNALRLREKKINYCCLKAASTVFFNKHAIVIGPTPPGTGVIADTRLNTSS